MALLPNNEIESELSYAYLHAVAAKAGMACEVNGRHSNKLGIDATITANDTFGPDAILTDISLHIQLKATTIVPTKRESKLTYFLHGITRYEKLRRSTVLPPRILVVLFLPKDAEKWLQWSPDRLIIEQCAWWESLRGAPESTNNTGVTVYLPETQTFSPIGLKTLMTRLAKEEELLYNG